MFWAHHIRSTGGDRDFGTDRAASPGGQRNRRDHVRDRGADPHYLDENGFPSFEIDATTEPDGAGGYVELNQGVYEVTLGGTASNRVVVSAWPGSNDDTIRIPVEEGFFTQAFITCDEVGAP